MVFAYIAMRKDRRRSIATDDAEDVWSSCGVCIHSNENGRKTSHHERIVQAISGLLLGFRRDDSVISKTRAVGKTKCAEAYLENLNRSVCDRRLRLCSYALHNDTVRLTCLCCTESLAPTLVVCERLQQHS